MITITKRNVVIGQAYQTITLKPEHDTHSKNIDLSKPRSNKDVKLLKTKYCSVLQGKIGTIKDIKANIVLKDHAVPKFCKVRPVPFPLRKPVEEELDKIIADGVAYSVTSSEWATPLVIVPKPYRVRLYGDY